MLNTDCTNGVGKTHSLFFGKRRKMAGSIKQIISGLIEKKISELGYELVEVEFTKQGKDHVLIVYIDCENGITLDDCECVSRAIDPIIDEADPIQQSYCLCVSSLGLDRPLKTTDDFKKAVGKCLDIKLYKNMNGTKLISGRLVECTEDSITVEDADDNRVTIGIKDAAKVTEHIDF